MAFPLNSVNHRFPSGPVAAPQKLLPRLGGDSLINPAGLMRPIRSPPANHRFPSGPVVIAQGPSL